MSEFTDDDDPGDEFPDEMLDAYAEWLMRKGAYVYNGDDLIKKMESGFMVEEFLDTRKR